MSISPTFSSAVASFTFVVNYAAKLPISTRPIAYTVDDAP